MTGELRLLAQIALGIVFLLSFLGKARKPKAFLRGVDEYGLLPRRAAYAAGAVLIPVEGFLALSLLTGWQLALGAPLALASLLAFVIAVSLALKRKRDVPCYCMGGEDGERISARTVARLGLLLTGAALVTSDPALWAGPATRWMGERVAAGPDLAHAALLSLGLLAAGGWALHAVDLWKILRGPDCDLCSD